MTEQASGLIHMTAHMIRTADAQRLITAGIIIAAACAFLALCAAISKKGEHKWRYVAAFAAIAILGAVMTISGARQPMQKVIYCCAQGPVNLETVAATYDIIEVDGAFIKIAER